MINEGIQATLTASKIKPKFNFGSRWNSTITQSVPSMVMLGFTTCQNGKNCGINEFVILQIFVWRPYKSLFQVSLIKDKAWFVSIPLLTKVPVKKIVPFEWSVQELDLKGLNNWIARINRGIPETEIAFCASQGHQLN